MTRRALLFSTLLAFPLFAAAQQDVGLVHCGRSVNGAPVSQMCGYTDLVKAVQDVLNFIIYQLATPIAILMFAVAGFKLVWSQGDPGAEKSARKIFTNTLIGYAVMLAAFLIVKLIFSFVFPDDFSILS